MARIYIDPCQSALCTAHTIIYVTSLSPVIIVSRMFSWENRMQESIIVTEWSDGVKCRAWNQEVPGLNTPGWYYVCRRIDDSQFDRFHLSLAGVHCFKNVFVGKQNVRMKECLTPFFSTLFQLCMGGPCAYPCFPGVLLTSISHNILSKPLAAFPHNHRRNNGQR